MLNSIGPEFPRVYKRADGDVEQSVSHSRNSFGLFKKVTKFRGELHARIVAIYLGNEGFLDINAESCVKVV